MHNSKLITLTVLALISIALIAQAQGLGPVTTPKIYTITLQIHDSRTICADVWQKSLEAYPTYQFAAGKNFTLIIRERANDAGQYNYPEELREIALTAVANSTGFVKFNLTIQGVDDTKPAAGGWYVALVLNDWPDKGIRFLVYEWIVYDLISLEQLITRLTGSPQEVGPYTITTVWGVWTSYSPESYAKVYSAAIHVFFLAVRADPSKFAPEQFTGYEILTVAGRTFTWQIDYHRGATLYAQSRLERYVASVLGYDKANDEVRPFIYLASYVSNIAYYDSGLKVKIVRISPGSVSLRVRVDLTLAGVTGTVIDATFDSWVTDYGLRLVGQTWNWTRFIAIGDEDRVVAPLSCGLVAWRVPLQGVTIGVLLDVKGNPILSPESFIYKIQVKLGNSWVTLDRAYGAWKTGITDLLGALRSACRNVGISPISSFNDLLECYRRMDRDTFRNAIYELTERVRLYRLVGLQKLKNLEDPDANIETGSVIAAKLVVEYNYNREGLGPNAVVLEMPLLGTEPLGPVDLTVSVLPVQVRLWKWGNTSFAQLGRDFYYTDADEVAGLRFVVSSDNMYLDYTGDKIVTVDPWSGQLLWTLPPYEFAPAFIGTRISVLSLVNASGYLPLPPIVAIFTEDGEVKYLSYQEALSSDIVKQYEVATRESMSYQFRIYQDNVLVGTANLIGYYPAASSTNIFTRVDTLLEADYSGSDDEEVSKQAYDLEVSETFTRIYDREHVVHIAIFRLLQNVLIRDICGNVITGLPSGLANAYIELTIPVEQNGKTSVIKISRLPLASEVPIRIVIPIDEWGIPQVSLVGGYFEANATLYYYGYTLLASGSVNGTAPVRIPLYKAQSPAYKPVVYVPLSPVVFRVWSSAVYLDVDPRKDVLMGFVVSVLGADGNEISRGITNKEGNALLMNVPVGVNVTARVRTIVPSSDKRFAYTYDQEQFGSSYRKYLIAMGYEDRAAMDRAFWPDVYTLGTRGSLDSGKVVFDNKIEISTAYACRKDVIDLEVEVFDLVVRVLDKTGQYLLTSQYIYFGPYPGATEPKLVNVTLVVDGGVWNEATMWRPPTWDLGPGYFSDHIVRTDFRIVGMTGMKPVYRQLAEYYLAKAKEYAGCPTEPAGDVATKLEAYGKATNALALAAMASWLANFSTTSPAAVFVLTSNQPKGVPYLCDFTPETVGTAEIARLFMKGQRMRFIVWYMGYKVFDDYVTITGPVVNITTDVYPVAVNTVSKSNKTSVETLVGFTFTDAFVGHFVASPFDTYLLNASAVEQLVKPFDALYRFVVQNTAPLEWLISDYSTPDKSKTSGELKPATQPQYNDHIIGWYYGWGNIVFDKLYGDYVPATAGSDFVYVPNLAIFRNAMDPVRMAVVYDSRAPRGQVCRNITVTELQPVTHLLDRVSLQFSTAGANARYTLLVWPYDPSDVNFHVIAANETMFKVEISASGNYYNMFTAASQALFTNGTLKTNYAYGAAFNHTLNITIIAKRGVLSYTATGDMLQVDAIPEAGDTTYTINVQVVIQGANFTEVVEPVEVTREVCNPAPSAAEYIVSFDRWVTISKYYWYYRSSDVVERLDVFNWLTESGTCKLPTYLGPAVTALDTEYRFRIDLEGSDVFNYRTATVTLNSWRDGSRVEVVITAYNLTANPAAPPKIDSITYNLTTMLSGVKDRSATVRLSLHFGKVAERMFRIVTENQRIRYVISVKIYTSAIDVRPDVTICKLVPLYATYQEVSMYDCEVPGRPRIDPTMWVTVIDPDVMRVRDPDNYWRFVGTWLKVGFGTPITYVVKSGDVALLPAWYNKTAVYGSRIARIWLINASSAPSLGPALGTEYAEVKWVDPKATVVGYKLKRYLVVNYVPNLCPAGYIGATNLDEFDGTGRITALGFGTSGTSSLIIGQYLGVPAWNASALWAAGAKADGRAVYRLPTVALDSVTVENMADYPIYIYRVRVRYVDPLGNPYTYAMPVDDVMKYRVDSGKTLTVQFKPGVYGFGRTYMVNVSDVWFARVVDPGYRYRVEVFHGGLIDALKYFGLSLGGKSIADVLSPIYGPYVTLNALYASHLDVDQSKQKRALWTYNIFGGKKSEYTRGVWEDLTIDATDVDYKYVFSVSSLPLREIRDWNDRPLANQTVALFGREDGRLYAVVYTDNAGRLVYSLPELADMGKSDNVRVSWYDGYLRQLLTGRPEYTIWIYDQATVRDVTELGNATVSPKIRTYVYPVTVSVYDEAGRPLSNMWVRVIDAGTTGYLVNAVNRTASDGGAQVVDLRVSKYANGTMSQIPATSYYYEVYDSSGILVASGKFDIQRGASVPATGFNVQVRVSFISEVPVRNSATRGYIVVKGVKFLDGQTRDVKYNFTVAGGVMKIQGRLPLSYSYPVEIYVTHVTLGGQEVPVKGGQFLVYSGTTADLAAGLDFADRGLTGVVSISAVDATGAPRADWTVQVLYGSIIAAEGKGTVNIVLPRTNVLGQPYTVRVVTNAVTPEGKALVKEQALEVTQKALAVQIPISTVRVVVQVVDGFGNVRQDWPVVVENVVSGMGRVEAEVVEGQRYVARATGLGFTNTTAFEAKGPQMVVMIKIPTAKITAQAKDGFGKVRSDWPVEVVGVAAGQGTVGPVEVLAGQYTVKTSVFGKEFTQPVELKAGQSQTVTVQVPTGVLNIIVVDDDRKPIDRYVTAVEISGPVSQKFTTPPKDLEVLAGDYTIAVTALGKQASVQKRVEAGRVENVEVIVPGTAGLDFLGTRIPLPTLVLYALLLLVIVVILAIIIIEYNNWRRRRLMQILAPPK